jgi:diketogulonate reductase-like aldo/keto reductase
VSKLFYFGELVLLPDYRGQGIGINLLSKMEQVVREEGTFTQITLSAIEKSADDHQRPANYISSDSIFLKQGFIPHPELNFFIPWTERGSKELVDHRMSYWIKDLIYQIHWPDPKVSIAETAGAMDKLFKAGLIRVIGVSNFSPEQMEMFRKTAPLHVSQPPYNLFEREIEKTVLSYCLENKIATLGYGSLCRGLLSGKMKKNTTFNGDDLRLKDPKFQEPRFSEYLEAVRRLEEWVQEKYQRPLLALAVRFSLDKGISVPLWGARRPDQLNGLDAIWGWKLTPQDFEEIDQILSETIKDPVGPEFMAPPK